MKKNIIIWIVTLVLLVGSVSAELKTDNSVYWSFDNVDLNGTNIFDSSGNGILGINNGSATGQVGILDESFYNDGNLDYLIADYVKNWTILSSNIWINTSDKSLDSRIYLGSSTGGGSIGCGIGDTGKEELARLFFFGDGTNGNINGTTDIADGKWHMITCVYNNSNSKLYVDGIEEGSVSISGKATTTELFVGSQPAPSTLVKAAYYDETSIWDRALTIEEVTELYNNGLALNPYNQYLNFTITANDAWNGSSLTNINATIYLDNGTTKIFSNSTGNFINSLIPINYTGLSNITLTSTGYFPITLTDYNLSTNLVQSMSNSLIRFNATDFLGNPVTNANFTINGITKDTDEIFRLKAGNYNVSFNAPTYFEKNLSFTVNALDNTTININNTINSQLNISVYSQVTSSLVQSYNLTIVNETLGVNIFEQVTNFTSLQSLITGTYNITVVSPLTSINTSMVSVPTGFSNYQANVIRAQTVNFFIRDEITHEIVSGVNFTLQIVGTTSRENTTSTGNITLSLFDPGSYTVRWFSTTSSEYDLRSKNFDINPQSVQTVDLYVLNTTGTTSVDVVFEVFDENLEAYEGATVSLGRWSSDISGYVNLGNKLTDSGGQAIFKAEETNAFYQYSVEINGVNVFTSATEGQQFIDTLGIGVVTIPIYVNTVTDYFDNQDTIDTISSSLVFTQTSNTSGYFTFTASDTANYQYCLEIKEFVGGVINSTVSCNVNTIVTIVKLLNATGNTRAVEYTAQGYVVLSDGSKHQLEQATAILNEQSTFRSQKFIQNAILVAMILILLTLSFSGVPTLVLLLINIIMLVLGAFTFTIFSANMGFISVMVIGSMFVGGFLRRKIQ